MPTPSAMPRFRISGLVTNTSSPTSCTRSPSARGQRLPAVPVAFGDAVLDRDDRILAQPVLVEADHLLRRAIRLAGLLERVASAAGPQLARGDVERDEDVLPGLHARPCRSLRARLRAPRGSTSGSARSRLRRRRRSTGRALLRMPRSAWKISAPMRSASANDGAPTGITMNSWKSTLESACAPPFRMFIIGTGSVKRSLPYSAPMCR